MKILVIDDEESLLKLLKLSLKNDETSVGTALTGEAGVASFQKENYDIVLCDIGLPDVDGIEVLRRLKEFKPETPVIMITAHGSINSALAAMKLGAYDYIQKPFEPEEIQLVIKRAAREKQLESENERLRKEVSHKFDFSNIIGSSTSLKSMLQRLQKAIDTKSTILLLGESGTGKELLAKAVHYNSPRKAEPLVVVDCTSIPANLLESELFGHAKGAFTGADRMKVGLCEEAHKGSLFLDEIGELPLELQSKLLRLIQENTIRRVGDTKSIAIDVRIIAATHRNLEEEVKAGRFRQDLFYRLNVVPIHIPSLRERREDIPLLANFFLRQFAKTHQRMAKSFHPDVLNKFATMEWPGNIRQLENLVEQLVIMSEGAVITPDLLPPIDGATISSGPTPEEDSWDLKKAIARVTSYTEEFMIRKALTQTENNKTKAAELLGLSRRALIYKVQEYRIEPNVDRDEAAHE